jgi:5-hydroxyisourate hydrolase-like protein (transthyretin family)
MHIPIYMFVFFTAEYFLSGDPSTKIALRNLITLPCNILLISCNMHIPIYMFVFFTAKYFLSGAPSAKIVT